MTTGKPSHLAFFEGTWKEAHPLQKLAREQTSLIQKEIEALRRRMSVPKCLGKRKQERKRPQVVV
jgi:hypothetical protein